MSDCEGWHPSPITTRALAGTLASPFGIIINGARFVHSVIINGVASGVHDAEGIGTLPRRWDSSRLQSPFLPTLPTYVTHRHRE